MLYREIIAVCSHIHTKHINTLCGQNVELLNVKLYGTYSDHWALNCGRKLVVTLGAVMRQEVPADKYDESNNACRFPLSKCRLSTSQRHTQFPTKLSTQSIYLTTTTHCSTVLRLFDC